MQHTTSSLLQNPLLYQLLTFFSLFFLMVPSFLILLRLRNHIYIRNQLSIDKGFATPKRLRKSKKARIDDKVSK